MPRICLLLLAHCAVFNTQKICILILFFTLISKYNNKNYTKKDSSVETSFHSFNSICEITKKTCTDVHAIFVAPRVGLEPTTTTICNMVVHLHSRSLNSLLLHHFVLPVSSTGRGRILSIREVPNLDLANRTYTKKDIVQNLFWLQYLCFVIEQPTHLLKQVIFTLILT